ncbi:MAG: signal peptidase II [Bryobacteraceae bacterium]|nr:signal peptidase II [Bryobacteraceae bacterium]MDW8378163.1 signal peptidase II [Bryobacterales bacterium]
MMARPLRFAISAAVFAADRISKLWIENHISAWETWPVIPGVLNIVHTQNRGAAFGLLAESEGPWRTLILIGLSALVMSFVAVQLWKFPHRTWPGGNWTLTALSLVLGGAIGNLYDRIWRGSVTDFIQVFIGPLEWPSFNVADAAISTGAVMLLLSLSRGEPAVRKSEV